MSLYYNYTEEEVGNQIIIYAFFIFSTDLLESIKNKKKVKVAIKTNCFLNSL